MLKPLRIYCDGKKKEFAAIAVDVGYLYGVRLPAYSMLDIPIFFADVDWKNPDAARYIREVNQRKPSLATVIDIETPDTFEQALQWANQIIDNVEHVIFIPKFDVIEKLPRRINGKEVLLGYSVPSSYGGTEIPIERFLDYRIHLLGGSPQVQMRLFLQCQDNIFSVDGNYCTRMANAQRRYWTTGDNTEVTNRFWVRDAAHTPEEIFRQSCVNILAGWDRVFAGDVDWLQDRRKLRRSNK